MALDLCACSLGPAYRKPDIAPPRAWQTTATQETVVWPSTDWWRGFNSPELDDLIATAERANDDLAAAVARVHQAEAQVRINTAPLLPTIDASGTGTRQRQFLPMGAPLLYNLFNTQLTAAYELDFWGKNRAVRSATLATEAANRYDRETVELTVMANVASTYFTVIELRDRLSIAHENLASAGTILSGLKIDASVGTTTALDVAQQETVVATLSAAIPPLEEQLRQQLDALAVLTGREPQQFDITRGSLDDISHPAVNPGLPAELLARRPDVASAEAQLIAANADIQAARAAFLPNIELTAAGGFESTTLEHLLEPGSHIYNVSAGITQPIFHGGAILGQYQYSKARYAELLADYHKAVISAFANVEDALTAVERSAEQLQRQQNATDVARRAYQMSQAQFRAGTVNILTVLNTETALFSAEDALAQVKLGHLQALVSLFNALGGGWQR